jgi:hypothetical protein
MYLSILTLNVKGLNSPSKDTDWQTRFKRKIQLPAAYRRPTSLTEISTGLELKAGRRYTKPVVPENRRGNNTYLGQSRLQTCIDKAR